MKKKKILIVEDEPSLLAALTDKLKRAGFEVVTAKNGAEGLQKALKERPDVTLADIIMPKMDGLTMIRKIRETSWGQTAKIILLTNLNAPEKIEQALDTGTHDYLVKADWKLADVVKTINKRISE